MWHKSKSQVGISAVSTDQGTLTGEEAHDYLERFRLGKRAAEIPPQSPPLTYPPFKDYLPFPTEVSPEEVKFYALQGRGRAPGPDGVQTDLLEAAWEIV